MNIILEQLFKKYQEGSNALNDPLDQIDIKELSEIINYIEENSTNKFTFLSKIEEPLIEKIVNYIEPNSESQKLKGSILFIKGLITTCIENEFPYTFNQSQSLDIMKFIKTIKEIISRSSKREEYLKNIILNPNDIEKIKQKLENHELLTPTEYEIIHKMCRITSPINEMEKWDEIITILNDINGPLLKEKFEKKQEATIDPFENSNTKRNGIKYAEKKQKIKEIMSILGYDFDKMDEYAKSILLNGTTVEMELMANTLINTGINRLLNKNNERGLALIITCNKSYEFEAMLNEMKNSFHLTNKEISLLIKYASRAFTKKGYENFKQNYKLLENNNVDILPLIYKNPSFLSDSYTKHEENFKYLAEHGIDLKDFINQCSSILKTGFDIIINNFKILEKYHYDFSYGQNSYAVLCAGDLANTIDQFIELGLNEYIHTSPSIAVKNIRTLIVKRIYFAQKNNRPIWKTPNTEQTALNGDITKKETLIEEEIPQISREINPQYDDAIEKEDVPSENEIEELIKKYPELEKIDAGYRPMINTKNYLTQMKYKTELCFGTTIISRLKAYKAFKALKKIDVPDKEALLYGISYNSILEQSEYDKIKRIVYGNQIGEKTL